MSIEDLSPDDVVLWQWGFVSLRLTIVYTWLVMALLVFVSWLATRRLTSGPRMSRWQNFLEISTGLLGVLIVGLLLFLPRGLASIHRLRRA